MGNNLDSWKRDWRFMSVFFSGDEISAITKKLNNLKIHTVVFCSYENRFARSGGLSAVTTNILPYLKEINHIPRVILMTPFHSGAMNERHVRSTSKSFNVLYNNKSTKVEIFEYQWDYDDPVKGSLTEYYVKADGYFNARNNLHDPYTFDSDNYELNAAMQSVNSLFFCKAVPFALQELNIKKNIILHLHEWQTSLIAFTAKEAMLNGTLESCGTVQTMHNSYDSSISRGNLSSLIDTSRKKKISGLSDKVLSAYQIGLQLIDAPVTTVSEHFAEELTSDRIQTKHFAPHLQHILKASGVFGINNGMFVDISREYPKGKNHTLQDIEKIKSRKRKALLRILTSYKPPGRFGDLTYGGRAISHLPDDIPILVMSGRLDPIQKGYSVFLRAIENFAEDEIKVILTPMPVNPDDLDYFYEIACKCKGNITVFPIRMKKGYYELQTGATFGIMPSIYEPFGAAVEYMANGTVNIGRATGGLVDQIDAECGFLFKEDAVFYTRENMMDFMDTSHIIQMRKTNPWAQSMADNLSEVIRKAIHLYQHHREAYYQMIINGFKKAGQFNWEENVIKYHQVYTMISSP